MAAPAPNDPAAACALSAGSPLRVCDLPPLPDPDHHAMNGEAACGTTFVLAIIGGLLAATFALVVPNVSTPIAIVAIVLMATWTCLALWCLLYLLCGDPGRIPRDDSTCFPLPDEVRAAVLEGRSLAGSGMRNIENRAQGQSYCVRCLVWRDDKRSPHHCSVCQRCTLDFDHHCGVFGRCIAGKNMPYFKGIIACGCLGFVTFLAFLIVAQST
eukprot:TRINITY_DN15234_c0_g1_i1.p1 TRINITY_DN15234_c0_g1~~TRINITY_DN15234_c0_g1_i1.p1  ORF type:complete len:241 (+),score=61.88 TRINITY_DN15234_c0_g1_i1:85-723(+)